MFKKKKVFKKRKKLVPSANEKKKKIQKKSIIFCRRKRKNVPLKYKKGEKTKIPAKETESTRIEESRLKKKKKTK